MKNRNLLKNRPRGTTIVVGVTCGNEVNDYFWDLQNRGYSLNYEVACAEIKKQVESSDVQDKEAEINSRIEKELSDYEETEFLIGDWKKDKDGKFVINKAGKEGFAAIYSNNTNIICIEYSKTFCRCRKTSPCYIMANSGARCGDLDSCGNETVAYSLPTELYNE